VYCVLLYDAVCTLIYCIVYMHHAGAEAQQAQAVERSGDLLLYGALIAALHKEGLYNEADAFYSRWYNYYFMHITT
jgi:hypothetical protein